MAKRRADETALHDSPSKKCYRSLHSVDVQLQRRLPPRGESLAPPPLLALLGRRCGKRPRCFEDTAKDETEAEAAAHGEVAHRDAREHVADVSTVQTSGSFEETSRTFTSHKKRHREDAVCPNTVFTKAKDESDADTNTEDCTFNSFQYWRAPLPELDLSLLQDASSHSQANDKDVSSEAMET
ncbi:uncharacterized protein wu:fa19b12 isoform X2 [Betta splendens]|uniref:Uncharacterized protein wu:fa19b12 isoform X2 n=1 Tax=Betta splendens TaxID=158456 RepID=A0A8M1HJH1_BETSP|nr:uncharacterized protein wu:fa19b12 isoform X2 [Betta splendens]